MFIYFLYQQLKLLLQKTSVFIVENEFIGEREVVLGKVIGESVEILQGLDSSSKIVLSVRGLEVGPKNKT